MVIVEVVMSNEYGDWPVAEVKGHQEYYSDIIPLPLILIDRIVVNSMEEKDMAQIIDAADPALFR